MNIITVFIYFLLFSFFSVKRCPCSSRMKYMMGPFLRQVQNGAYFSSQWSIFVNSLRGTKWVRVDRFLVLCVKFCRSLFFFLSFFFIWSLYCLTYFYWLLLNTPMVSSNFWSLYCLTFFYLLLLNTPMVSFGHCIVWPTFIDYFWILLWYLLVIVLSDLLLLTTSE